MNRIVAQSLLFFIVFSVPLHAQDTLYRFDGIKSVVKIIAIDTEKVKYHDMNDFAENIHVIAVTAVSKIVHADGRIAPLDRGVTAPKKDLLKVVREWPALPRNYFSLNAFDLFYGVLTVNFERTFLAGNARLKVPFSMGFNSLLGTYDFGLDRKYYYSRNKNLSVGVELYYYPFRGVQDRFFFGPAVEVGRVQLFDGITDDKLNFMSVLLQVGFTTRMSKRMQLSTSLGLGYSDSVFTENSNSPGGTFIVRFGLNVSYKF